MPSVKRIVSGVLLYFLFGTIAATLDIHFGIKAPGFYFAYGGALASVTIMWVLW